jgi:hypothetical protein
MDINLMTYKTEKSFEFSNTQTDLEALELQIKLAERSEAPNADMYRMIGKDDFRDWLKEHSPASLNMSQEVFDQEKKRMEVQFREDAEGQCAKLYKEHMAIKNSLSHLYAQLPHAKHNANAREVVAIIINAYYDGLKKLHGYLETLANTPSSTTTYTELRDIMSLPVKLPSGIDITEPLKTNHVGGIYQNLCDRFKTINFITFDAYMNSLLEIQPTDDTDKLQILISGSMHAAKITNIMEYLTVDRLFTWIALRGLSVTNVRREALKSLMVFENTQANSVSSFSDIPLLNHLWTHLKLQQQVKGMDMNPKSRLVNNSDGSQLVDAKAANITSKQTKSTSKESAKPKFSSKKGPTEAYKKETPQKIYATTVDRSLNIQRQEKKSGNWYIYTATAYSCPECNSIDHSQYHQPRCKIYYCEVCYFFGHFARDCMQQNKQTPPTGTVHKVFTPDTSSKA